MKRLHLHQHATLIFLVLAWSPASQAASSDSNNWPSYRGAGAMGVMQTSLPTSWNVETGDLIRWNVQVSGLSHSSPIVWEDRIFLTTAERVEGKAELKVGLYGNIAPVNDEGEITYKVLCYRLTDGKLLWEKVAYQGEPKIKRHTKATHANSTPATDGTTVVAMFGSEGLYAYDLDGNLQWKKDFGVLDSGFFLVKTAQWGFASSPILHKGRVIVQADVQDQSFLAALDSKTGKEIWRTNREEVPTWSTPTIAQRPASDGEATEQIIVNGWKHIGGYDFATGKELWKLDGGGDIPVPTPVITGQLALLTSAHGAKRPIRAIRLNATGDIKETEAIAWEHDKAGNYMQTPIVVNGIGYFCMDNGVLTAYEIASGELLFKTRLGGGKSGFSGSAVSDGSNIFFPSEDGDVYIVKASKTFELVGVNELGETLMATPAISEGQILFRTRSHLIAIGS